MEINVKNVRFVTVTIHQPVFLFDNLYFCSQCYGHSTECYYNPEVDQRGLSINTDGVYSGGGVCLNCTVRTCSKYGLML